MTSARDPVPCTVLHTLRSLRVGGITRVVQRVAGHLHETAGPGLRQLVCALRDDRSLERDFRAAGLDPVFVGHEGPLDTASTVRRLRRLVIRERVDVVHTNQTLDFLLAGAAARSAGARVVTSLHWLPRAYREEPSAARRALGWSRLHVRAAADRLLADAVVAVSEAVRRRHAEALGALFPLERTLVVYPGIDLEGGRVPPGRAAAVREELGLGDAFPVLLTVGRLQAAKRQHLLLPVLRRVAGRHPRARLLVAGDGPRRRELEAAAAAAGVEDAVRFLGWRDDVDALLAASDVFVLASSEEAAPVVVLEAMRAARPVVATAVGGIPEMVEPGRSGYLAAPDGWEDLAEGVLRVADSPDRAAAMGREGRRIAERRFRLERTAEALAALYRSLAAGSGLPPSSPEGAAATVGRPSGGERSTAPAPRSER